MIGRGFEVVSGMDLVVPIRDRRQHRRVLTLKNFGKVLIGLVIFLAGITIESNFRRSEKSEDYGRLLSKQVHGHPAVEAKKADVVVAPIEDQTAADPLLVSAQNRQQWLGVEPVTTATAFEAPLTQTGAPSGIVITRGKQPEASQPTLSGGIFRQ